MNTTVFFTTGRGITSTSASTIANFSNEKRAALEAVLEKCHFYDITRDLVGTNSTEKLVKKGYLESKTLSLLQIAEKSAQLCALNAWLREAVKAKEVLLKEVSVAYPEDPAPERPISPDAPVRMRREEYCKEFEIELPKAPEHKIVSEDEIVAEFTPAEYAEYIGCNSKSAVFGQLAHADGELNEARKALHEAYEEEFCVTDTMIEHRIPTVSKEIVDKVFTQFQSKQRAYNAEYNAWKNRIKKTTLVRQHQYAKEYAEANAEYRKALNDLDKAIRDKYEAEKESYLKAVEEYDAARDKWLTDKAEYEQRILTFRKEEQERISALKILIPDSLQAIFTELDNELRSK